ncbi:MAG: MFS transporter, partial [Chloroflexi bacterium]|nr:MFS transporter [Chloroflexota bacterium]
YLSVFATRLGASNFWIGVLVAGPALVSIFWLLPAGRLVERQRQPMRLLNAAVFIWRLFILIELLAPWLSPRYPGELLAILVVLQGVPAGLVTVAFTTAMSEAVGRERLGHVVSRRTALSNATTTLSTLGSVVILARFAMPTNYQICFGIAFLASLVSTYYVSRLRLPDRSRPPQPQARRVGAPWLSLGPLREAWASQRPYVHFVLGAAVFYWGLYTVTAVLPIRWIRELQVSDAWVGVFNVCFGTTSVLGALAAPRVVARWGNSRVLAAAAVALVVYPVVAASTHTPLPLAFAEVWVGFFFSLFNVSLFHRLIELSPPERRASYVGLYNAVINVAIFAAPLVSTNLASYVGVTTMILAGGIIRLLSGVFFWRIRHESLAEAGSEPAAAVEDRP